jgi:hypothetical protein
MDVKPESDRSKDRPTMRSTRHTGFLPNVGGYSSPGDNSWYSDRARPLHSGPREPLAECRNEMEQPKEEAANSLGVTIDPGLWPTFGKSNPRLPHVCRFARSHATPFPPRSLLLAIRRRRSPLSRRIGRRLPRPGCLPLTLFGGTAASAAPSDSINRLQPCRQEQTPVSPQSLGPWSRPTPG